MTSFTSSTGNYPQGADTPIRRVVALTNPLPTNWQNFIPGDEWWNKIENRYWKIVDNRPGAADWVEIGGPTSGIQELTANIGGAVTADDNQNINVVGDAVDIQTIADQGTNSIIISVVPGSLISTITGNTGTAVSPNSSGNVDVVGDNINITVAGDPLSNTLVISSTGGGGGTVSFLESDDTNAVPPNGSGIIFVHGDSSTIRTTGNIGTDTLTVTTIAGSLVKSFTGNTGTAVPTSGYVLNIRGTNGLTASASGNTVTLTSVVGYFGQQITGNTGGAVKPDFSGNWNIVGDGTTATVAGNPLTNTLTITSLGGSSPPGIPTLINTATASNQSTISFTHISGFTNYFVKFENLVPVNNIVYFSMQVSTNNGVSYSNTAYGLGTGSYAAGAGTFYSILNTQFNFSSTSSASSIAVSNNALVPGYGEVNMMQLGSSVVAKCMNSVYFYSEADTLARNYALGRTMWNFATPVNAIQFFFNSGNILTGNFYLYGYN